MYHEKLYFSELSLHTATRETWILVERAPFSGLFLRSHTHTDIQKAPARALRVLNHASSAVFSQSLLASSRWTSKSTSLW